MLPQPVINNIIQPYVANNVTGILRSIVFGGGLAYAVSNGYWHHTPLIFLSPFAYGTYQVYMSQALVIDWTKQTIKQLR